MLNPTFIESCFGANYIGIRGYCNDASESGYYINDEVSITQKLIADLASSDDVKSSELVKRLIRNAVRDTCNDFITYMNEYGKFLAKTVTACRDLTSNLDKQLKVKEVGRYTSIRIDYVKVTEAVTMYIDYDGIRESVALTEGVNKLNKLIISDSLNLHFFAGNSIITLEEIPDKEVYFTTELVANEGVSGLSGEVDFKLSSSCSFEKLICDNQQLLARPIFYHAVGLLFKEKYQSSKIDPFISNSKEESKELYQEYLYGFEDRKSKYHDALVFAVKGLRQTIQKNHCFTCSGIRVQSLI